MIHVKLQIGCLIVLLYIAFIYLRECKKSDRHLKTTFFDELLLLGVITLLLDGITAYTVNHLDSITPFLNRLLHGLFLISLDSVIFIFCLYMLFMTGTYPKARGARLLLFAPFVFNLLLLVTNLHRLNYVRGNVTNYSMGIPAYSCFFMVAVYILVTIVIFLKRWQHIEHKKRAGIFTYLLVLTLVTGVQMVFPETLVTSIAVTILIVGVYMNLEDPALKELSRYHSETVIAFANLIERRDTSTGSHVKRTSTYVEMIAQELCASGQYSDILTRDYVTNLVQAAPLHDIGKVSVPDAILRKPGKLTDEEFAAIKVHTEHGGAIVRETFQNLGSEEYLQIACDVARHHHEKWNGTGYPDGLKGDEIPLCARIMAVADVFDAIAERRCYRAAMPLEECFAILAQGRGEDFDPVVLDAFLRIRHKVEQAHSELARPNV